MAPHIGSRNTSSRTNSCPIIPRPTRMRSGRHHTQWTQEPRHQRTTPRSAPATGPKAEGVSLVGPGGLAGVTKTVLQVALDAEMAGHLGYDRGRAAAVPGGNHRNGTSPKRVLTEVGPIP